VGSVHADPQAALARSQAAVGKRIGDYTLTDIDGQPVRLATLRGKPLVVSFIYTGCFQICPTTTRFLDRAVREAHRALGTGTFNVATVGFNLPFDTPTAMHDFRRRNGVDTPGWQFLAGDAATIDGMARDLGFVWVATAAGFDHLTQATIIDGDGRVVQQVYGEAFELPMFVAPLKALARGEATPAPDLASILERVRILCTVYDPRSGRYRLNYGLFVELLVGLSILGATGVYLVAEWRRNRSTRAS
jgi:protein SCO1/2